MTTTDHAFIRVFDDKNIRPAREPEATYEPVAAPVPVVATENPQKQKESYVLPGKKIVSEVYAGVAEERPVFVERRRFEPDGTVEVPGTPDEASPSVGQIGDLLSAKQIRLDSSEPRELKTNLNPSVLSIASAATLTSRQDASHNLTEKKGEARTAVEQTRHAVELQDEAARQIAKAIVANPPATENPLTLKTESPQLRQETASSPSIPGFKTVPISSECWTPQWEVDAFRWPSVCGTFASSHATSLADIMRPILSSAWQGGNVIALTSCNHGEGVSTLAMCLARMAADYRVSVALVEGHLERPTIGTSLGLAYDRGWNNMSLPMSLTEVAIGSLEDRMVVLPVHEGDGIGGGDRAGSMLVELSDHFDLVVLDAGPMFSAAYRWFTDPVSRSINGTIVVRDTRATQFCQIDDVCSRLQDVGIQDVAIVDNFQDPSG